MASGMMAITKTSGLRAYARSSTASSLLTSDGPFICSLACCITAICTTGGWAVHSLTHGALVTQHSQMVFPSSDDLGVQPCTFRCTAAPRRRPAKPGSQAQSRRPLLTETPQRARARMERDLVECLDHSHHDVLVRRGGP